jgi:hypothetical protein
VISDSGSAYGNRKLAWIAVARVARDLDISCPVSIAIPLDVGRRMDTLIIFWNQLTRELLGFMFGFDAFNHAYTSSGRI